MKSMVLLLFILITVSSEILNSQNRTIKIYNNNAGRIFEGIGALSAGASSKLLLDYQPEIRDQVLDYLFKPKFGASLQHLKVEIGGDVNSTDGTEPSHAHSLNEFLKGALKYHDIRFDFTGIWNEREHNTEWIKLLRKTLDSNGLDSVKIIAPDTFDWRIAGEMKNDKELYDAVYAIGIHYNERWGKDPYSSTELARSLNKSLRNSEGGPWKGDWDGFEYLIKLYNRNYITGKSTNVITWSLVTSYYDNLSIPSSGLMYAKTPSSGYFEVQPAIWAAAHTTQFAEPGWRYVDSGCGYLEKGSYVTLKSPDSKNFSIIIETADTTGSQMVTFDLDPAFGNKTLHIWKTTRGKCDFENQADLKIRNHKFTLKLEGKSAYSITTTTGQKKGYYKPPENNPFPFPYKTGFENDSIGQLAKYFMDQAGVFEVSKRTDGKGKCLKQVIDQQGIEWEVSHNPAVETILGDTAWTDYEVHTDVIITENTGTAKLLGRIMDTKRGIEYPDGYTFIVTTGNKWTLMEGNRIIVSGWVDFPPFKWHHMSLKFSGGNISSSVNEKELFSISSTKFTHGLAGLGSTFNYAEFDNFEVK